MEVRIQLCLPNWIQHFHNSVYHSFFTELSGKSHWCISWALFNGVLVYLLVFVPIWHCHNFCEFMSGCLVSQLTPNVFFFMAFIILVLYPFHIKFRICLLHSTGGMKGWGLGLGIWIWVASNLLSNLKGFNNYILSLPTHVYEVFSLIRFF